MIKIEASDVLCSSEDAAFPARNLLVKQHAPEGDSKKWLCENPAEDVPFVILKFKQPFYIGSLEIGNEGSAYIQVEAGRSCTGPFKTLIKTQNLMSRTESLKWINCHSVKKFFPENMLPIVSERWDTLKILCSQPYNRNVKYGLRFITLEAREEDSLINGINCTDVKGKIYTRADANHIMYNSNRKCSPDLEESCKVATSKNSINQSEMNTELKDSAHLSNTHAEVFTLNTTTTIPCFDLSESAEIEEIATSSGEKPLTVDVMQNSDNSQSISHRSPHHKNHTVSSLLISMEPEESVEGIRKRVHSSDGMNEHSPKQARISYKPFKKLLEGVEIVISGFVNPDRSEIRSRALKMGAKYSPFWNENSTHLVCAYLYTPKYKQAQDEGLIVTREWVDECFFQRKRLPWKRFALKPWERHQFSEQDNEVWELVSETSANINGGVSDRKVRIDDQHSSHGPNISVSSAISSSPSSDRNIIHRQTVFEETESSYKTEIKESSSTQLCGLEKSRILCKQEDFDVPSTSNGNQLHKLKKERSLSSDAEMLEESHVSSYESTVNVVTDHTVTFPRFSPDNHPRKEEASNTFSEEKINTEHPALLSSVHVKEESSSHSEVYQVTEMSNTSSVEQPINQNEEYGFAGYYYPSFQP